MGYATRSNISATLVALAALAFAPAAFAAPPETSIESGPDEFTQDTTAHFVFASVPDTGATFTCQLDTQVGFSSCETPHTVLNLSEGEHTLRVKATVNNETDASPAVHNWTVDLTPPETTLTKQPDARTRSTTAVFEFESPSPGINVFRCSLNGAPFAPCESPVTYSDLGDGTREFRVRARDRAGNVDATPATVTWTVDATPPDTTITKAPAALMNVAPQVEFEASESGSKLECAVNSPDFTPCESPLTVSQGLRQGDNAIRVRATDAAGNTDASPARATWVHDSVAPAAPSLHVGSLSAPAAAAIALSAAKSQPSKPQLVRPPTAVVAPPPVWLGSILATSPFQFRTRLTVTWGVGLGAEPGLHFDVRVKDMVQYGDSALVTNDTRKQTTYSALTSHTYCFGASATDAAGNLSEWTTVCTTLPYRPRDFVRVGSVKSKPDAKSAFTRYLQLKGAGAKVGVKVRDRFGRFTLLATKCKSCGSVQVVRAKNSSGAGPYETASDVISLKSNKTRRKREIVVFDIEDPYVVTEWIGYYAFVVRVSGTPRIEGIALLPW